MAKRSDASRSPSSPSWWDTAIDLYCVRVDLVAELSVAAQPHWPAPHTARFLAVVLVETFSLQFSIDSIRFSCPLMQFNCCCYYSFNLNQFNCRSIAFVYELFCFFFFFVAFQNFAIQLTRKKKVDLHIVFFLFS